MSIWRSLENATATIYNEAVTGQTSDGMGGTTDVTSWNAVHTDIGVGFEPGHVFSWAKREGDDTDYAGALFVPDDACDDINPGDRVDITHRGDSAEYRAKRARVIDSPTGAHAEVAVVTVGDED